MSARGADSVPVIAPEPLAAPAISTGPAWNGPSALQSSLNMRPPSAASTPAVLAFKAAPARLAEPTASRRACRLAWTISCGFAPSSRSSSG